MDRHPEVGVGQRIVTREWPLAFWNNPRPIAPVCRGLNFQRVAGSRSITINANDPGSTGPLLAPGGVDPNFAETMNTR